MKTKRVFAVILNYNDADTTMNLCNEIKSFEIFEGIIVVDGASTDGSYDKLSSLESDKIYVIKSNKNGGYGYGNNYGIKFAIMKNATHVVVANPDVQFTENSIEECLKIFDEKENVIAVAPKINAKNIAFKFSPPFLDAMYSSMTLNKLFKPRYYSNDYFKNKNVCAVDAIPGSLVVFDVEKFVEIGMYDENVFLYHEEMILGRKIRDKGYKSYIVMNAEYKHYHSVSVNKSFKSATKLKTIVMKSHEYYLKNYGGGGFFSIAFLRVMKPICIFEAFLWNCLLKRKR